MNGVVAKDMKNELRLLNLLCFLGAIVFLGLVVVNALLSGSFLTTDNLFITMVCLVMAVVFIAVPLLQLKDSGSLPVPFLKKPEQQKLEQTSDSRPPLLDAKGRAVPPDVRSMVANMRQAQTKE